MDLPLFSGVSDFEKRYDAFIIGVCGVIHDGGVLYPRVIELFSRLRQLNKEVILLTNIPRTSSVIKQELSDMGLPKELYKGVLSSGEIVYHKLKSRKDEFFSSLGMHCYHLGPEKNENVFEGLGYKIVKELDRADFVLNTGNLFVNDSIDTYLPLLSACIDRFLPMVCVGADKMFLSYGQPDICAGALASKYENMGGRVCYVGKPDASFFNYCLEGLTAEKHKVAVVGDSFETDIAGAEKVGLDSVFICGGIHARELGMSGNVGKPDEEKLENIVRHYGMAPSVIMPTLVW